MDELVEKARKKQPGLIVVDRAVPGKNQNYLTPENRVPDQALPFPWESCIIAGGSWSWIPNATYMSGREVVHLLVDIVAKGGNLLLNIAPGPEGQWHEGAYEMLQEMGAWMDINSEAIYGTRAIAPYKSGKICFTHKPEGPTYSIYMADESESEMPKEIILSNDLPLNFKKVYLLGFSNPLEFEALESGWRVKIPEEIQTNPPCEYAWVLKFQP